jgi:hypothetical protein
MIVIIIIIIIHLYFSPNMLNVIKPRAVRWPRHRRNTHTKHYSENVKGTDYLGT